MQTNLQIQEEDYLDEDKEFKQLVKKQNFCVISMLTPNSFPENKREQYKEQKILGIKIRGVFETYEDAKKRADQLQKIDKHHNIFVGEVGKWLPFNVDIATMETEDDPVYRENALNQYMKAYKNCLKEEEIEEKERKEETLKANNAKIVTNETPISTGLGCPEITIPGVIPESLKNKLNNNSESESKTDDNFEKIDEEINSVQTEKSKIVVELEDSKNNLKELESKLLEINQLYSNLKK